MDLLLLEAACTVVRAYCSTVANLIPFHFFVLLCSSSLLWLSERELCYLTNFVAFNIFVDLFSKLL